MRKALICILSLGLTSTSVAQTPSMDPTWELYIDEEFNTYNNVSELSQRWDYEPWELSLKELEYLYGSEDPTVFPYLYHLARNTSFAEGRNFSLEAGDGDGQLNLLPKFEPNGYSKNIVKNYVFDANGNYQSTVYKPAYFTMTTGGIISKEQLQYGYFETRMKMPYYPYYDPHHQNYTYYGVYPSFWLFGGKEGEYTCEFDIYEMLSGIGTIRGTAHVPFNRVLAAVNEHYWDPNVSQSQSNSIELRKDEDILYDQHEAFEHFGDSYVDFSNGWHTFALEWNPNYAIFYVDGIQVRKTIWQVPNFQPMRVFVQVAAIPSTLMERRQNGDVYMPSPATNQGLNLNIPGVPNITMLPTNYKGYTSANPTSFDPINDIFYASNGLMDPNLKVSLDYVKIYKLKRDCDEVLTSNMVSSNFSNFTEEVKKSVTLGSTHTISSGQQVNIRASDYVLINSDFEVQQGGTFSMTAHGCPEAQGSNICNLSPYINCGFNHASYDNSIKSYIEITGNGCESELANGLNLELRARDYIDLKEVNSSLYSDLTLKIDNSCP